MFMTFKFLDTCQQAKLPCALLMEIFTAKTPDTRLMELTTSREKKAGDPSISGNWRHIRYAG